MHLEKYIKKTLKSLEERISNLEKQLELVARLTDEPLTPIRRYKCYKLKGTKGLMWGFPVGGGVWQCYNTYAIHSSHKRKFKEKKVYQDNEVIIKKEGEIEYAYLNTKK